MSIRIHNFMGRIGWELQKKFPMLSSNAYLKLQFFRRGKSQQAYIKYFMEAKEPPYPLVVNLETINRCNSDCAFCTANKNAEKRPFQRMEKDISSISSGIGDTRDTLPYTEITNLGWM